MIRGIAIAIWGYAASVIVADACSCKIQSTDDLITGSGIAFHGHVIDVTKLNDRRARFIVLVDSVLKGNHGREIVIKSGIASTMCEPGGELLNSPGKQIMFAGNLNSLGEMSLSTCSMRMLDLSASGEKNIDLARKSSEIYAEFRSQELAEVKERDRIQKEARDTKELSAKRQVEAAQEGIRIELCRRARKDLIDKKISPEIEDAYCRSLVRDFTERLVQRWSEEKNTAEIEAAAAFQQRVKQYEDLLTKNGR